MTGNANARIALIAPMKWELRPLAKALSLKPDSVGGVEVNTGRVGDADVLAIIGGIGTSLVTTRTERLLDATTVDHLIVCGIAGGIDPSLAIGDLVVPESVVDLDNDAEYKPHPLGNDVPRGKLATSGTLHTDPGLFTRLAADGVRAIDMETSAVAAVCESRGVKWSVFRSISDMAGDGTVDPALLELSGPDGGGDIPAGLKYIARHPGSIPQLFRAMRGGNLAASNAAKATIAACRLAFG